MNRHKNFSQEYVDSPDDSYIIVQKSDRDQNFGSVSMKNVPDQNKIPKINPKFLRVKHQSIIAEVDSGRVSEQSMFDKKMVLNRKSVIDTGRGEILK